MGKEEVKEKVAGTEVCSLSKDKTGDQRMLVTNTESTGKRMRQSFQKAEEKMGLV